MTHVEVVEPSDLIEQLVPVQAGRNDLRYAVQLHSHLTLADALNVAPSSRGGYYKVTADDAVQGTVQQVGTLTTSVL